MSRPKYLEAVNEELTWSNVPYADIVGASSSTPKRDLANVTNARFFRDLSLSGNVTFIRSAVKIPEAELERHPRTRPQTTPTHAPSLVRRPTS